MPSEEGNKNLIPFVKGKSGNPKGRPKGVENSSKRLLRLLSLEQERTNPVTNEKEYFNVAEQMDMALISKALKGDIRAYEAIIDRLEGKPKQTVDTNTSGLITNVISLGTGIKPNEATS